MTTLLLAVALLAPVHTPAPQCKAICASTQQQCKRHTTSPTGLCWQHQRVAAKKAPKG